MTNEGERREAKRGMWEYNCVALTSDGDWQKLLDDAGREGWELIQIDIWGTMPTPFAFFKRVRDDS